MSHYYQNDPNLKSNPKEVYYDFRKEKIKLLTDSGIFSKERIDFGTNLLLNILPDSLDNLDILDVGCGYGIIGLSVAKRYKKSRVELIDVNERAIEIAKENAKINNITNAKIYLSDAYESVDHFFDVIITNPPIRAGKVVVHKIILGSVNYLKDNGKIYLVIRKSQGAPSLIKEMEKVFSKVEIIEKKNGYYILEGCKN